MVFVNLIFNRNSQNMIGYEDKLMYSIQEDMKWFREITSSSMKNIIVMGYNTWKSLPKKPLPNRINMVITSNHYDEIKKEWNSEQCIPWKNYEDFIEYTKTLSYDSIFIIGGSQLYKYVFENYPETIRAIYETRVDHMLWDHDITKISLCDIPILYDYKQFYKQSKICPGYLNIDKSHKEFDCAFSVYVQENIMNQGELHYLQLLQKIYETNTMKQGRNSEVLSCFGEKMIFDLREGFPLLTTKKMGWKTILRELLWFISGSTCNKELQRKNVHIWDQNASAEFLKSRGLSYPEGDLGPVYGFQWRHFGAEYKGTSHDYSNQGVDQLKNIITMIKQDPTSRRIILSAWNPCDLHKMALPPCHVMVQFNVDGEYIDAQLYQRSGDMFLGVPYNIASYSFLLHIIGALTNYIPRYLHHVIGDAHIYKNHIDVVKKQLTRVPYSFPHLSVTDITDIDSILETNFIMKNYKSHNKLSAEMIS